MVPFERPVPPGLDLRVDLLVQLAHCARPDPRAPRRFGDVFDSPLRCDRIIVMKIDLARTFADEAPDAIVATTLEGNIVYWNKGAESTFG